MDLSFMDLTSIPLDILQIENLKTIDLSNNYLESIPDWLGDI